MVSHQNIQAQIKEQRQQLMLLDNMSSVKAETETMQADIRKRTAVMAELNGIGLGISGYGALVELSSIPSSGVVLSEVEAVAGNRITIKGKAADMTSLLKYAEKAGDFGGVAKESLIIEDSRRDENGDVEFICQGKYVSRRSWFSANPAECLSLPAWLACCRCGSVAWGHCSRSSSFFMLVSMVMAWVSLQK